MLIPFYIFSHEKGFPEYNSNERKLAELKAEYRDILERLDELEQQEVIGAFDKRTIIELSGDVLKEIAQKYENVRKGVGDMMGGALIETSARTILNQGISQGISLGIDQGINQNQRETALRMLKRGKMTIEEIAEDTGLSISEVEHLAGLQKV
jgi:predicted transposase/invertase (TIGR01784 family)